MNSKRTEKFVSNQFCEHSPSILVNKACFLDQPNFHPQKLKGDKVNTCSSIAISVTNPRQILHTHIGERDRDKNCALFCPCRTIYQGNVYAYQTACH